ncbi:hypothetical protein B0T22DRAFT_472631 [Podospora appendiculata]|uniref:Uncharacterized protein n=1 Tax=Podospora appendiculata TaxID=314037 RepID=A0AAE1C7M4_9PEZI|nr:hypothetical protein B0T22DRAFT_472631 [Podospora appendiculata]
MNTAPLALETMVLLFPIRQGLGLGSADTAEIDRGAAATKVTVDVKLDELVGEVIKVTAGDGVIGDEVIGDVVVVQGLVLVI